VVAASKHPPKAPGLRVRRVPVEALTPRHIDEMWGLYDAFYDHVDRATFDADLEQKGFVLLGTEDDTGMIGGFSTVAFFTQEHQGRRVGFYFTGDTVFHPRYWGRKDLHWATLKEWIRWKLLHPTTPLYWYLICSGHRTYLSLVRNFPTHWPHHQRSTPPFERGLLDAIGRRRFGDLWKPARGIISTGGTQPVFKASVAPLDDSIRALPEIQFFLEKNPDHERGDELAMIALVDAAAVAWMAGRWIARLLPRRHGGGAP
jgi:hypothetical protein